MDSTNTTARSAPSRTGQRQVWRVLTRRISAWAGPVTGIAAVLCAAIAVTYASGTRVDVSIPVAADVGGPTPTGSSSPSVLPLNTSALTLVHPTHPVEVLDGSDAGAGDAAERPSRPGDPTTTTGSPRAAVTIERDDDIATPDASPSSPLGVVPTVAPTPSSHPAQPTNTWSDDDPARSPTPSASGWKPTGTPSPWPATSHSHGDDIGDDGTGGAPQPSS